MKKEGEKKRGFFLFGRRPRKTYSEPPVAPEGSLPEETQRLIRELQKEVEEKNEKLRNVRKQLEIAQNKYSTFYNSVPTGYCTVDRSGRILEANMTAAELLSAEKRILIDTRFDDYIIQEEQHKFIQSLQNTFETETRQICDVRLKRKHGPQFYARLESATIRENDEQPTLCRILISDITDLTQAREALLMRESELALFNRVSKAFSSTLDLDQILIIVLEEVRRLLEVTACSIWLSDLSTNELVCRQAIGPYSDTVRGWRMESGQGIVGWVANTGRSLIVPDAWADDRHFKGVDLQTGHPLRSILSVPMRVKENVIGVLQVLDAEQESFDATDQALQELLAAMASIAIENAQLYEQTQQDESLQEILRHEIDHRVNNTMASITGLFSTVRRHAGLKKYSISHMLMTDMINRVKGLRTVHKLLSDFEWKPLPLSELVHQLVYAYLKALAPEKQVSVDVPPSSVRILPEQTDSLSLVLYELVSNTVKHALVDRDSGALSVYIDREDETICIEFHDDGPGCPDDALTSEEPNLGFYLIQKIVSKDLHGELELYNDNGTVVRIRFKTPENSTLHSA